MKLPYASLCILQISYTCDIRMLVRHLTMLFKMNFYFINIFSIVTFIAIISFVFCFCVVIFLSCRFNPDDGYHFPSFNSKGCVVLSHSLVYHIIFHLNEKSGSKTQKQTNIQFTHLHNPSPKFYIVVYLHFPSIDSHFFL